MNVWIIEMNNGDGWCPIADEGYNSIFFRKKHAIAELKEFSDEGQLSNYFGEDAKFRVVKYERRKKQ